jgi:hypothetical protein
VAACDVSPTCGYRLSVNTVIKGTDRRIPSQAWLSFLVVAALHAWLISHLAAQAPAVHLKPTTAESGPITRGVTILRLLPAQVGDAQSPHPEQPVARTVDNAMVRKYKSAAPPISEKITDDSAVGAIAPVEQTDAPIRSSQMPFSSAPSSARQAVNSATTPLNLTLPSASPGSSQDAKPWLRDARTSSPRADKWQRFAQSINSQRPAEESQSDGNAIVRVHGGCFEIGDTAAGKVDPFNPHPKASGGSSKCMAP